MSRDKTQPNLSIEDKEFLKEILNEFRDLKRQLSANQSAFIKEQKEIFIKCKDLKELLVELCTGR